LKKTRIALLSPVIRQIAVHLQEGKGSERGANLLSTQRRHRHRSFLALALALGPNGETTQQ